MRRTSILALVLLAGCTPQPLLEIARGPAEAMRQAATAARDCGIAKLRVEPIDAADPAATAKLVIDPKTPANATACLRAWVRTRTDLQRPV
ncbi:MAG: hypothetical protein EOP68_25170 [Sphingomonas sp.]|nr:MAG: hypothetical protein EOP68_25170 [Sphingomonas sp.]